MKLPQFLVDEINNPPRAGAGVHGWMFRVARNLHAHMEPTEMQCLLRDRLQGCGRAVSAKEIQNAVTNSARCAFIPPNVDGTEIARRCGERFVGAGVDHKKWPDVDREKQSQIAEDYGGLAELWELSNPRLDDDESYSEWIIDLMFPGNPLLCCGWSTNRFDTRPREQWRGESGEMQFIVPSPMVAVTGITKDGRESKRCLGNTGPRRFLVIEFDSIEGDDSLDRQAATLQYLGSYAPLVVATYSGAKSLHGLFCVYGQNEDRVLKFFRHAVALGADPATWCKCQLVRLPGGRRNNGKRQTVWYVNESLLKEVPC